MSTDAVNVICEAEKSAEEKEREATEKASSIISKAHSDAKELIAKEVSMVKAAGQEQLDDINRLNETFLKKAEDEISEDIKRLRSAAEGKKKEVAEKIAEMLL